MLNYFTLFHKKMFINFNNVYAKINIHILIFLIFLECFDTLQGFSGILGFSIYFFFFLDLNFSISAISSKPNFSNIYSYLSSYSSLSLSSSISSKSSSIIIKIMEYRNLRLRLVILSLYPKILHHRLRLIKFHHHRRL